MSKKELVAKLRKMLAEEKKEILGYMKDRGDEITEDGEDWYEFEDLDPRESSIWEDGYYKGMEKIITVVVNSRIK